MKMNNKGEFGFVLALLVSSVIAWGVGKAIATDDYDKLQWHKEKTVDTVNNPGPKPWDEGYTYQ